MTANHYRVWIGRLHCRYTVVILAAKRARDIIDGKPILTDAENDRPVSLAAHEIAEDLITYKREEI